MKPILWDGVKDISYIIYHGIRVLRPASYESSRAKWILLRTTLNKVGDTHCLKWEPKIMK